jgi:hypothetical protein
MHVCGAQPQMRGMQPCFETQKPREGLASEMLQIAEAAASWRPWLQLSAGRHIARYGAYFLYQFHKGKGGARASTLD